MPHWVRTSEGQRGHISHTTGETRKYVSDTPCQCVSLDTCSKRRRQRRAVEDDDDGEQGESEFGSRVKPTGSLRPTGSPRPTAQRTRRPLNPNGRSLQPTPNPSRERPTVPPRRVVVRTTTPTPSTRYTVPTRQYIPGTRTLPFVDRAVQATPAHTQQKRRRKVKRIRTTAAPVTDQDVDTQTPQTEQRQVVPTTPVPPQLPFPVYTHTFFNSTPTSPGYQTSFTNPYLQHVNSPQSLYDQLTNSIFEEAGKVPTRSFTAPPGYPQHFTHPQYGYQAQPQTGSVYRSFAPPQVYPTQQQASRQYFQYQDQPRYEAQTTRSEYNPYGPPPYAYGTEQLPVRIPHELLSYDIGASGRQ